MGGSNKEVTPGPLHILKRRSHDSKGKGAVDVSGGYFPDDRVTDKGVKFINFLLLVGNKLLLMGGVGGSLFGREMRALGGSARNGLD